MTHRKKDFQQYPIFITGQTFANESGQYPGVSMMSSMQASDFLNGSGYMDKACVSLNEIFCPFDKSSGVNRTLPYAPGAENTGYGYIPTSSEEKPIQPEFTPYEYNSKSRGVGLRTSVVFVGPDLNSVSGIPAQSNGSGYKEDSSKWMAGELDMTWSSGRKKWVATDVVTGFLTSSINGSGYFTISGVKYGGVDMPESLRCNNFDPNLNATYQASKKTAIVVMRVGDSYLPIYVGC